MALASNGVTIPAVQFAATSGVTATIRGAQGSPASLTVLTR